MSNCLFWILKKANVLISPKPCEIERFRRNFRPTGYIRNVIFAIFKKISPPQKWRPFWIFEFLPKMAKHKFASLSLTVRDRAISLKFSPTGYLRDVIFAVFKKFSPPQKWRPFWIFEYWQNTNFLLSPEPCEIERFHRKFQPIGYLSIILLAIFKKFSPPQKWRPFWIFEFLPKMAKHKFASISLTMWDRAISSKFSTHRVSKECNLYNFQKNFPSPKMLAILIFRIFAKMAKHKFASISLTVRDRAISSKFSTHRVSKQCNLCNLKKKTLPKNGGHFDFSNFCQKWQNTNLLLSP